MKKRNLNKSELSKITEVAKTFAYEGNGDNDIAGMNYIGGPGEYDFGGGDSFANEYTTDRVFSWRLANTMTTTQVVALCPGYYDTLARLAAEGHSEVTAIFGDGDIKVDSQDASKKVTATSMNAGKSIFGFLEFIKDNPLRVIGMSIQCSNAGQLDQIITIENVSPLTRLAADNLVLSMFRPATQLATDKIDCPLIKKNKVLEFNRQNLIKFPILSGATVVVNFYIGAIDNRASQFSKKATKAHSNMRRRNPQLAD